MLNCNIKVNRYYRHYKNGIYKVLMIGKCTETNQTLIVYSKFNDINVWIRPLSIFDEEVLPGIKRFSLIGDDEYVNSELWTIGSTN